MGTGEPLFEQLNHLRDSRTIILGIGSSLKSDDGVGPFVCKQLQHYKINAEIIDAGTVPENYIQVIVKKAPAVLLVIDAIDFGAEAGAIEVFKPEQLSSYAISTHTLSPRLFVDMLSQQIKVEVYFIGIQPAQTHLGQSLSPQVKKSVQRLSRILTDIFSPGDRPINRQKKPV
jgi:hydrogenase 3 maturation protease